MSVVNSIMASGDSLSELSVKHLCEVDITLVENTGADFGYR